MINVRFAKLIIFLTVLTTVTASCTDEKHSNPVVRENGYAWIPIADTAFLIPEKTWLKSFGHRKTDGLVDSFFVHATAPDIEPWSEAVNAQMYPERGPGKRVDIFVKSYKRENFDFLARIFPQAPQSRWRGASPLVEVESDHKDNDLRKFRDLKNKGTVFYEYIESNKVRYFIYCNENENPPVRQHCHLSFPWTPPLFVDLSFTRNYLPYSIRMADKITEKLEEFEAAGKAYQDKHRLSVR